jgi:hypothetical protein
MPENKKPDFVVTDKRKFTVEGELREAEEAAQREPKPAAKTEAPASNPQPAESRSAPPMPPPPSAAEQQAQHDAYKSSGKQFEPSPLSGQSAREFEMTFERLVASLYMTAMMQLGVMHEEGQQPMADLVGAKQTIDTLGVLQDKTKGNLADAEQNLLQNCLYELRMAFIEITNAIARGPQPKSASPGPGK